MANEKLSQKAAATTPLGGDELLYAVQGGVSVSVTVDDVAARASGAVVGADGVDGLSAYQVAVVNGFVGTEPEWLLSLVGADSVVPGPQGEQGLQGIQGEVGPAGADSVVPGPQGEQGLTGETGAGLNILGSYATLLDLQTAHPTGAAGDAYIIAGDLYVWDGTWNNAGNIQGPQGPQGPQGLPGADGAQGLQGIEGAAGADSIVPGPPGYTPVKDVDYFDGAQGPQGIQGVAGEAGSAGVGVPVGGTAGQVLAKVDGTNYNSTWIDPATGSGLTNPMTTAGDIIIGGVSGVPERLAKGTDGQVLTMVAGVPAYADASGGSATIDWTSPIVVTDTANLTYGKHYIVAVTTADKTLTLPEIIATDYGKMIVVEIAAATTKLITIDGYSTQVIDGTATRIMWAKEVAQLVATSAGWTKVGGKSIPLKATIAAISLEQQFNSLTWTKLLYNTNSADAVNMVDIANKRIVVKRAAFYSVSIAALSNTVSSAVCNWLTSVYKNTSILPNIYAKIYKNSTTAAVSAAVSQIVPLESGDIIEGYAYFDAGSFTTSCIASTTNMQVFLDITEISSW